MSDEEEYDVYTDDQGAYGEELFIDLSDKEAASAPLVPFPTDIYHLKCTDGELQESKSVKNPGKPMYNLEFTIQDGPHAGRKVWTYACLWAGASFTIVQIAKAMHPGVDVAPGKFRVPGLPEIIGTDFEARIVKMAAKKDADGSELFPAKNEIKWFKEWTGKNPANAGEESLLP
jgi:hypothetical protein